MTRGVTSSVTRPSLWLAFALLAIPLSGCIAYDDSGGADQGTTDASGTDAAGPETGGEPETSFTTGTRTRFASDDLYTETWTGARGFDDDVTIGEDYDYLLFTLTQTGQAVGRISFTDGAGNQMDEGTLSMQGGPSTLVRTLPGDAGTGHIDLDGVVSGVGSLSIMGMTGTPAVSLLSASWAGQTLDAPLVLDTKIRFYVPSHVGTMALSMAGTGQNAPGMSITDPDGETAIDRGPSNGPDTASVQMDAKAGIWTLHLEGVSAGPVSISVVGTPAL